LSEVAELLEEPVVRVALPIEDWLAFEEDADFATGALDAV
jgi:hypothetical protein